MSHENPAVARLRARLDTERPAIAMAAHNPLAAKLAAEAILSDGASDFLLSGLLGRLPASRSVTSEPAVRRGVECKRAVLEPPPVKFPTAFSLCSSTIHLSEMI